MFIVFIALPFCDSPDLEVHSRQKHCLCSLTTISFLMPKLQKTLASTLDHRKKCWLLILMINVSHVLVMFPQESLATDTPMFELARVSA